MRHNHALALAGVLFGLFTGLSNAAVWQVTNTADTAIGGTLRWAINAANTNPGDDTITFALPGSLTISPTGALPTVSDVTGSVVIDGASQPGYAGVPLVRLNGALAGAVDGLAVSATSNEVRCLLITRFQASGIQMLGRYNRISGCVIVSNSQSGIYLYGRHCVIGGTNAADRNLLSGNGQNGLYLGPDAYETLIQGNYIGTDATGLSACSNKWAGISITSSSNVVGGSGSGARNIISGNVDAGVNMGSDGCHRNLIEGNYIGVDVNGTAALPNVSAIRMSSAWSNTIRGNVLSGSVNFGVDFGGQCYGNVVAGNFIGTDASGASALGNALDGIYMGPNNKRNQIGGDGGQDVNIISGNKRFGVFIDTCTGAVICSSAIGVSPSGARLGNAMDGVRMHYSSQIVLGGSNDATRNIIAGNSQNGVHMYRCSGNDIRFNFIGLNAAGAAVSNTLNGILEEEGSGQAISDNVISGNGEHGVSLQGASGCVIKRNRIGTDPAGTGDRGNHARGLCIQAASPNNIVGGRWPEEGNVISGNVYGGILLEDAATTGTIIKGNRIGTDDSGTASIPNHSQSIELAGSPFNTIGSTNADERNIISGNDASGIYVTLSNSYGNRIVGNFIGLDAGGVNGLGNTQDGIVIVQGAWSNQVGGFQPGAGNRIAYNAGRGVSVENGAGNWIASNSIYRNVGLGVDLNNDGIVTANDHQDPDLGGNRLQNFPVIQAVSNIAGAQLQIAGYLDSRPSEPFIIEFYGCAGPDSRRYGQGERSLAAFGPVAADASGWLAFTNAFTTPNPPPNYITALAHHANLRDTSEFSQRIMLDSDNDGMPDGYETIYFGGYTNGSAAGDADGDRVSNLGEFYGDSNPQDSNSFFHVGAMTISGAQFQLTAAGSRERIYNVFVTSDLSPTNKTWNVRSCSLTYAGDNAIFTGPRSATVEVYRVHSMPP